MEQSKSSQLRERSTVEPKTPSRARRSSNTSPTSQAQNESCKALVRKFFSAAFWTDWWSIEIVTIFLSIACFVSLVTVLIVYDNKTGPQLPLGITLNAIISVLATATKSSILLVVAAALGQHRWLWLRPSSAHDCNLYDVQVLDDASRGPWGALMLLSHLRGRWLAAIGALVTLLSMALEPFVQQAPLFTQSIQRIQSSQVNILRAITWRAMEEETVTDRWKYPINAAVARGIYYTRASPLSPSCPVSNCTWTPFQTLAMCHQCIDVTSRVRTDGSCRLTVNLTETNQGDSGATSRPCDYRIGNRIVATGYMDTNNENNYQYGMDALIISPAGDITENQGIVYFSANDMSLDMPGWETPVFAFYRLLLNTTPAESNASSPLIQAQKCAWNFCIQEHDVTLKGDNLSVSTLTKAYATMGTRAENVAWVQNTANITSSTELDDSIWVASRQANSIADALAQVIQGTVHDAILTGIGQWTSDVIYAMWNADPFENIVANLSLSLTQHILDRTQNYGNDSLVPTMGTYEDMVVVLRVRWVWLILPTVVLFLGLSFLVVTVFETRRLRVKIWKGSSLPLLYHGLDQLEDRLTTIERVSKMEEEAERIKVRLGQVHLSDQTMGWKLLRKGR